MCGLHPWLCIYLWQTRIVQVWAVCQLKVEGAGKKEIHRASSWETMEDLCDVKVIDTPGIKFWLRHFTALSKFSNVSKPSFKTPSHSHCSENRCSLLSGSRAMSLLFVIIVAKARACSSSIRLLLCVIEPGFHWSGTISNSLHPTAF